MDEDKIKCMKLCLREKITKEVVKEYVEKYDKEIEESKRLKKIREQEEEDKRRLQLQKLSMKHPLYEGTTASLQYMNWGMGRRSPFKRCTTFTKPIYETFVGPFKPE